ncbi:hypothetical protein QBC47DRAFT_357017 [Echria macrotheca]|uniref:Uncharacterized protein n=1 Tax=Echria macrotheca TaxID=438768 RepID=A0AAJ0BIY1_9PEZI|nr:hypothetical protein QBC47DRAFT_357017 [Echria macrotheca]
MLLQPVSVLTLVLPIVLAVPVHKESRTWIWEEPSGDGPAKRTWDWSSPGHDAVVDTDSTVSLYKKEKRTWDWTAPPAGGSAAVTGGGSEKRSWTWEKPGGGVPEKRTDSPLTGVSADSIGWDGPGGGVRKRGTEWAKEGGGNKDKRDDGVGAADTDGHIAADGFITVDKRGTTMFKP